MRILLTATIITAFASLLSAQEPTLTAPTLSPTSPVPAMADGHPDLSGFWKGTRETTPVGNIGQKNLPAFKLPLDAGG